MRFGPSSSSSLTAAISIMLLGSVGCYSLSGKVPCSEDGDCDRSAELCDYDESICRPIIEVQEKRQQKAGDAGVADVMGEDLGCLHCADKDPKYAGTGIDASPCSACEEEAPHCEVANMRCVACLVDGHCRDENPCTRNVCRNHNCIFPLVPAGSLADDNQGVCLEGGICVECLHAGHCSGRPCLAGNVCPRPDASSDANP